MDQLNVMDAKLREAADAIAKNDTDRLMANVAFPAGALRRQQPPAAGPKATATSRPTAETLVEGGRSGSAPLPADGRQLRRR